MGTGDFYEARKLFALSGNISSKGIPNPTVMYKCSLK
ncbi:uncharacterized protein G2W53_014308 [Senna tora]|uniref:Uncharacterized protein n=1 Tax=Senna tora TaxID=362788 RepID=A0A835C5J0_9FABA|nr:uncharacterized protein G2W53_014308 [Senna tora]